MSAPVTTLADLMRLLRAAQFDLSTEGACQAGIAEVLTAALPRSRWEREYRLGPKERPDFFVLFDGGMGVVLEVKAARQNAAVILRQLERYAAHRAVSAIVLLTNTAIVLPPRIGGKFAYQVSLGRAWL